MAFDDSQEIYLSTLDHSVQSIYTDLRKLAGQLVVQEETPSSHWIRNIVEDPQLLDRYFGRALAEMWLCEQLGVVRSVFCLALKYFCKCTGRQMDSIEDLKSISANDFAAISEWVGNIPKDSLHIQNLGIGCVVLRQWEEAIGYLETRPKSENIMVANTVKTYLALAYMRTGQYERATDILTSLNPRTQLQNILLGQAHEARGALDEAIQAFSEASMSPEDLGQMYAAKGDYDEEIKLYEKDCLNLWWGWHALSAAYRAKGDHQNSIATYRRASERQLRSGRSLVYETLN